VDHLAVARRRNGADTFRRLQDDHLAAGLCQPPRDGKTDHPRSDNDALNFVHSLTSDPGSVSVRSDMRLEGWRVSVITRIPTTIALFGMIFLSDRPDPFPNISQAVVPLAKH